MCKQITEKQAIQLFIWGVMCYCADCGQSSHITELLVIENDTVICPKCRSRNLTMKNKKVGPSE